METAPGSAPPESQDEEITECGASAEGEAEGDILPEPSELRHEQEIPRVEGVLDQEIGKELSLISVRADQ